MTILIDLATIPRMTKRIKQYKPKQNLSKAEVQFLSALLKLHLDDLEYTIRLNTEVAMTYKRMIPTSDNYAEEWYFDKVRQVRKDVIVRNKLAKLQYKLKRGLPE